jgi:hypothetical protein
MQARQLTFVQRGPHHNAGRVGGSAPCGINQTQSLRRPRFAVDAMTDETAKRTREINWLGCVIKTLNKN